MSRKPQPKQAEKETSEVAPEVAPKETPKPAVAEASPVTQASPRRKPLYTYRLPNGALVETY